MAKMVNPELEVVRFENEDVIAQSVRAERDANGNIIIHTPSGDMTFSNPEDAARAGLGYYTADGSASDSAVNSTKSELDALGQGQSYHIHNPGGN